MAGTREGRPGCHVSLLEGKTKEERGDRGRRKSKAGEGDRESKIRRERRRERGGVGASLDRKVEKEGKRGGGEDFT